MTCLVSLVGVVPDRLRGLVQETVEWAGEVHSCDPPRYRFNGLRLTLSPVAAHVSAVLPKPLHAERVCMELDEELVLRWSRSDLDAVSQRSLHGLLEAVASSAAAEWACVCDSSSGGSVTVRKCSFEAIVDGVSRALTAEREQPGITVFLVRPLS